MHAPDDQTRTASRAPVRPPGEKECRPRWRQSQRIQAGVANSLIFLILILILIQSPRIFTCSGSRPDRAVGARETPNRADKISNISGKVHRNTSGTAAQAKHSDDNPISLPRHPSHLSLSRSLASDGPCFAIYDHISLIYFREPFEMASAVSLPLKSVAFASSLILAAGGSRIRYRDLLIRAFTGPGSYSRTAVIVLLLINIKNWPFVWTVRAYLSHENRVRC